MIKIENLSIKYKSTGKIVFEDVSFDVARGEIIVLLGPSGCGKTTLLNYLASLLPENEIEVKGCVEIKNAETGMSGIRMVFQDPTLLPWRKVPGNISLGIEDRESGKEEVSRKVSEAVKMVGLEGFEDYFPQKLSVGMRQRVNFARAIVCDPEILLLDEPFSALDVNRKKKLQKIFLEIIRDRKITSIFVTHSIEEALEIGDKIYVFFDGKKIKKGLYANKFKGMDKKELYLNAEDYLNAC
ncbi:MAG: hypothetical protein UY41_C0006G0009 [Candidatus Moranbacteria bacterium GW2011_GWE1_49_15]|nr:MAG: hypothetical protein UX75_C0014G0003 [Candidatus Moranbacteria bacterium GW2011_GWE2_47_10]KKW07299.1 MAG: hypothetical protein UY41_C0006G0009 [Candidatus Moranbacteria bacterium GW2011_GWE1_49_15]HBP00644.1 hypothetical protein [Candidatus Moranbacteria bacterium]